MTQLAGAADRRVCGYRGRDAALAYHSKHTPVVRDQAANAGAFFPIVHIMFSNIRALLVGTHHGVSAKHLPRYLREWSYRFHRRNLPDGLDGRHCSGIGGTGPAVILGGGWAGRGIS